MVDQVLRSSVERVELHRDSCERGLVSLALVAVGRAAQRGCGGFRLTANAQHVAETTDHLNLQGDALRALGDVLRVRGEPKAAAAALRSAANRYERKGNKSSLAAVAAELDALGL